MLSRRTPNGSPIIVEGEMDEMSTSKRRTKTVVISARKPSERFMRTPLRAKSKASTSERIRLADLTQRLSDHKDDAAIDNGEARFEGYRPGLPIPTKRPARPDSDGKA